MSNELTIYERFTNPLEAIEKLGDWVAESKLVNCANRQQGRVLAMEALMRRTTVLALFQDYHVTDTGLTMRADAMLRKFRERGGNHLKIERTADAAEIELIRPDGEKFRERFTWEDAKKEPFPFRKDGQPKTNWATPRARTQMLWARVVSEVVGYAMPEVKGGYYTPEEMADEIVEGNGEVRTASESDGTAPVVDAEFEPAPTPTIATAPSTPPPPSATTTVAADAKICTTSQRTRIGELWDSLNATDEQRNAIIAKRGVANLRGFTFTQAEALIGALQDRLEKVAAPLVGESTQPADATEAMAWAPCDSFTVDKVKMLIAAAGNKSLVATIKEHLLKHGKSKIAELSQTDAEVLLRALTCGSLEGFIERSLEAKPAERDIPF